MNREQRRAEEKKQGKTGNQHLDVNVTKPIVSDGMQFRVSATAAVKGKEITFSMATVVCPLIYDDPDSKTPGFIADFGGVKRKIVGFDTSECLLMDIYTPPDFRKLGFGTILINAMKKFYKKMITGARSQEGANLMIKNGFGKTESGQLVWVSDEVKKKAESDEKQD